MGVDRKNGPKIHQISELNIPLIEHITLSNGIEVYIVNTGTQNLVQVEILYKGGRLLEKKKGVSRAVARMMKEGTKSFNGTEIAEKVDFYGGNISSGASLDYSYAKIFVLNKYLKEILPVFKEVLYSPSFTKEELEKYKTNCIQKLKVEKAKAELVAYKMITEKIFGEDHAYGYNSSEEIYNSLEVDDLKEFYDRAFGTDNCIAIISGKVIPEVRSALMEMLERVPAKSVSYTFAAPTQKVSTPYKMRVDTEDQIQTAIKIGRQLFMRNHPDFADLFILNTILGGYFGSRLMSSLREDKGYTYNIYSSVDMMMYDGYFNVSTEVGNDYVNATVEGIYAEIEKLQKNLVKAEELDMVKNYLSGNFLNMVDGAFKLAGMTKVIALNGLDFDFYQNLMKRIHTVKAEDLQRVAKKYLRREDMIEVIVGNPEEIKEK